MKGFKTSTVALCLGLAPGLGMAEIQPLDDSQMGNVTGQSGVTIELQTRINIDEVRYTDEGSLAVNDVFVGGANRTDFFSEMNLDLAGSTPTDLLDDFRMDIDVLSDGDAVINLLPAGLLRAVDVRVATGEWVLEGEGAGNTDSTTIMDNFQMDALIGSGTLRVDTATDTLNIQTDIAIDDLDFDAPFLALGVRDVVVTGADYDLDAPQPLDVFAPVELNLYEGNNATGNSSLAIDLAQFEADIRVGGVLIGGTSIGSLAMDNLSVSGTNMRVYGHQ
ncbi:hypothetical protein C8D92_10731 [Tamilnaduibacter salinus]|uniref:DUF6160 domain-containing protein n=1 Tax=Tamilnaduibacter salinus TaxID=1484056 RepID=A0A2U1CV73_9GAMM|nr:DUF6160 family protein [Tamilnaduibacter salinus]PVY75314.1 hypothetical protein C8D92_10731 [Tamilnaduibacter salinus]